ncbi:MAG: EAL domain-containing protein [Paraglaciecola sp.]|nr:EAL domain-containing protein [Paraglaciecola sp.]NCT49667.1 EAL domain-containing protein [Paraglaciecola sp.]
MAFQPIVDVKRRSIFGYEALVRGLNQESAYQVIKQVNQHNLYRFDQSCRVKAIGLAARLKIDCFVSINFMPNAVYRPELCIRTTLQAAAENNFPIEQIMFELTEAEKVTDVAHMKSIVEYYRAKGFKTALDDFGAGYSGLNMFAQFQPDIIKLDMQLIRNIDKDTVKQAIVRRMTQLNVDLGVITLAEGVETRAEFDVLCSYGIELYQGYLFAKPGFECLPQVDMSFI